MSRDIDICPNCLEKFYYYEERKIESSAGSKKVNQCPKCEGYFEASVPYNLWWSIFSMLPLFVTIILPDEYESLEIYLFLVLIAVIISVLLWRHKKSKNIIKEKGYWVIVETSNKKRNEMDGSVEPPIR